MKNKSLILLTILVSSFITGCNNIEKNTISDSLRPAVVYPKERIWLSPSAGLEAKFNPPSLLWPVRKENEYEIRLSKDIKFQSGDEIHAEELEWAMFNPHKRLEPGIWYWQVRSGKSEWSDIASFVISKKTPEFVTPEAKELISKIPADHPRILVWNKELDELRLRSKKYEETQFIIDEANNYLNNRLPGENEAIPDFQGRNEYEKTKIALDFSNRLGTKVRQNIEVFVEAYLLTCEPKYALAAKKWALRAADWDSEGPTKTNNFGDSNIMLSMAMVFDSCHDLLSPAEKTRLLKSIGARIHHFDKSWYNSLESKLLSNHVWQHIMSRVFMSSLAVLNELPGSEKTISYIYEIWLARSPNLGGEDGGWSDGAHYFFMNTNTLIEIPAILQDIVGIDFYRDPFYKHNIYWLINAFPPHSTADGFGDGVEKELSSGLEAAGYADALSRIMNDPYASWYSDKCLEGTGLKLSQDRSFRWYRIQRGYKLTRPEPVMKYNLPPARVSPDIGVVSMHSDLNNIPNDLMVSMRSGLFGSYSHMHADHNSFNIAYGGKRLFFNTGYQVTMDDPHTLGWFKHTQGHNGILIDEKGQPETTEAWGWIPRFLSGKQLTYCVGDASNAYDSNEGKTKQNAGLKRFRRHLLMLGSDLIIVYDELEADHPAEWQWLLHCNNKMDIDSVKQTITGRTENATGLVNMTGSVALKFSITDQFTIIPRNFRHLVDEDGDPIDYKNQWHAKAFNKIKTDKMRFLAIIQVEPSITGKSFLTVNLNEKDNIFEIGSWQIKAEMDLNKNPIIEVHKKDGKVSFTSSGNNAELNGKKYNGKISGSSKLVEILDGKDYFSETGDIIPLSIQEAIKNMK